MPNLHLTLMTFIPLLGVIVIMFIPKSQEKAIKYTALAFTVPSLLIALLLWFGYDNSGQYIAVEKYPWIPSIDVWYHKTFTHSHTHTHTHTHTNSPSRTQITITHNKTHTHTH